MANRLFVLLAVVLFALLASLFLDRPGVHYDEALEAGLPAAQLLAGLPLQSDRGGALTVAGRVFPLMMQNHIGATQVYAALPFVALAGPTAAALRTMTVVAGVVTLIATFLFLHQAYGVRAACYGSIWLATFPSFVFWSRQGVFVTSLASCFTMCAFAAAAHWWRTERLWAAGVAGWCMGLAVYSKLTAGWVFVGVVAWLVVGIAGQLAPAAAERRGLLHMRAPAWGVRNSFNGRRHISRSVIGVGLAGFVAGFWPFILYNMLTRAATVRQVRANAATTYLGANNTDVLANLWTRTLQLADVIRSGDHLWYLGGSFPSHIALISVVLAGAVLIMGCAGVRDASWQKLLFVPFLLVVVVVLSCFTISALWPTHFAIIVTFPAMLFGVGIQQLLGWADRLAPRARTLLHCLVAGLALVVSVSQVNTSLQYLKVVKTTGGLSFHSSAIYDVYRFLKDRPEHLVALDWGISAPIEYLSGGRVRVEEVYSYDQKTPQAFRDELRSQLSQNNLYITHATYQEAFQRREAFLQTVAAAGWYAETVNVSIRADGWPMIEVWQVRKKP